MIIKDFKPKDSQCAFLFSVDDLHPAQLLKHSYDAGGDLDSGVVKHLLSLINKHPELIVTLFTTADWREMSPVPTRKLLQKIPFLKDWVYLAPIRRKNYFNISRYPEFIKFFNQQKNLEIALHGLHHIHKGEKIPVEFQQESLTWINSRLSKMLAIFEASKIDYVKGFTPPAWNASNNLLQALVDHQIEFIGSARDIITPINKDAKNKMSGLLDVSIIYPEYVHNNKLIHYPINFQVTSPIERAFEIADIGGVVSVKGHMIKNMYGFESIDAITEEYMIYLDEVISKLKEKYPNKIYFSSMGQMTKYIHNHES